MSPRAGPSTSRTRNHRPRRFHFYCQEIRLGDDTFQMQFGCIRHNSTTATHSENNTSQMITNCASFTKNAEEPDNVLFVPNRNVLLTEARWGVGNGPTPDETEGARQAGR